MLGALPRAGGGPVMSMIPGIKVIDLTMTMTIMMTMMIMILNSFISILVQCSTPVLVFSRIKLSAR